MLDIALKFLTKELNAFLLGRTGSTFGQAEMGRLVDDTGKWAVKEDHIGVALINVEEERTVWSQRPETVLVNGSLVVLEPPLKLNLHVLFAAHFQRYDHALDYGTKKRAASIYVLLESTGISEPLPASEPRAGRRTALTSPLFPPPQKN